MNRMVWCGTALLVCAWAVAVTAQEKPPLAASAAPVASKSVPAPATVLEKPTIADAKMPQLVDLEFRLIEIRGDLKLPFAEVPTPAGAKAFDVKANSRILSKEDMVRVIDVCQADRRTNILFAPRMRLNVGSEGRLRSGEEVVLDPPQPDANQGAPLPPELRTRFIGTAIDATVTVPKPGLMNIDFRFEQSSLVPGKKPAIGNAAINMYSLQTKLDMKSGQTCLLRGLVSDRTSITETRVPILGDLPVVGSTLFSRKRTETEKAESMLLVTVVALDAEGGESR